MAVRRPAALAGLLAFAIASSAPVLADSSSPRLAAYYDGFMALCGTRTFEWRDDDPPRAGIDGVIQVGVGQDNRYALTADGALWAWSYDPSKAVIVANDVRSFHAGRTGLLIIRADGSLWSLGAKDRFGSGENLSDGPVRVADRALTASVGDGANYYISPDGGLHVRGSAHRGQYGDGKLTATADFVQTEGDAAQVVAHTGHALILKKDGGVWGTGGNIYGPLGRHGHGDKATQWGFVIGDARAIATGSSHSVAIRRDGSLWIWGRGEGLDPKPLAPADVVAVAAGNDSTVWLSKGMLWQKKSGSPPRPLMTCD